MVTAPRTRYRLEPGPRPIAVRIDDDTGHSDTEAPDFDEVAFVKWPLWWTIAGLIALCSPIFGGIILALALIAGWL